MSDTNDLPISIDVLALAARIRELEAQLVRIPGNVGPLAATGTNNCTRCSTDNCTDCGTGKCTHCAGDMLQRVLLPGELERLSGADLVRRLQADRDRD